MSDPAVKSDFLKSAVWGMAVLFTVLLTVASLLPSGSQTAGGWDSDVSPTVQNVLHLPAYALLTLLWLTAVDRSRPLRLAGAVAVVVACMLLGAALEWIQATAIPGRIGSCSDALLNTIGGAGGFLVWLRFRNVRRRTRSTIGNVYPPVSL